MIGATTNPFDGPAARRHSQYLGLRDGRPRRVAEAGDPPDLRASAIVGAFRGFVLNPRFSCVAARSAVNHETFRLGIYERLADPEVTDGLCRDLFRFALECGDLAADGSFATFVAAFDEPKGAGELEFERLLWWQLQLLHDRDAPLHSWDPRVSSDPDDPHFSFSFAGSAFFVIGLHPGSSRLARRFAWPCLVFNPFDQFERLRREGTFAKLRDVVRRRDEELQGAANPALADHGQSSEARQYSGRPVGPDWRAPFDPHPGEPSPAEDPASRCPVAGRSGHSGGRR